MGGSLDDLEELERDLREIALTDFHPVRSAVSELALLQDGRLRADRKRILAQRFSSTPRMNRHQRRRAVATKE